ncbi:hypothetical protein BCR39DRAFT_517926 [Naematelia encephala]|uniref:Uncharacterized protein n=1 Tax=Naematelia encephala TaxID=71784 RepID=A0A1Y2BIN7_9TREE|nr:hypothetical protein BCR39DRAFT_517926 [Naematelia encephala]
MSTRYFTRGSIKKQGPSEPTSGPSTRCSNSCRNDISSQIPSSSRPSATAGRTHPSSIQRSSISPSAAASSRKRIYSYIDSSLGSLSQTDFRKKGRDFLSPFNEPPFPDYSIDGVPISEHVMPAIPESHESGPLSDSDVDVDVDKRHVYDDSEMEVTTAAPSALDHTGEAIPSGRFTATADITGRKRRCSDCRKGKQRVCEGTLVCRNGLIFRQTCDNCSTKGIRCSLGNRLYSGIPEFVALENRSVERYGDKYGIECVCCRSEGWHCAGTKRQDIDGDWWTVRCTHCPDDLSCTAVGQPVWGSVQTNRVASSTSRTTTMTVSNKIRSTKGSSTNVRTNARRTDARRTAVKSTISSVKARRSTKAGESTM